MGNEPWRRFEQEDDTIAADAKNTPTTAWIAVTGAVFGGLITSVFLNAAHNSDLNYRTLVTDQDLKEVCQSEATTHSATLAKICEDANMFVQN